MYICLCTSYVPSACGGQTRASDALGLELQMVWSHHIGAGSSRRTGALNHEGIPLAASVTSGL